MYFMYVSMYTWLLIYLCILLCTMCIHRNYRHWWLDGFTAEHCIHQSKRHTVQNTRLDGVMLSLERVNADKWHMLGTTAVWRRSDASVQPLAVLTISLKKRKSSFTKHTRGDLKWNRSCRQTLINKKPSSKPPNKNTASSKLKPWTDVYNLCRVFLLLFYLILLYLFLFCSL